MSKTHRPSEPAPSETADEEYERFGELVSPEVGCQRCGATGSKPARISTGHDRPVTLCAGCLAAVHRACLAASRIDLPCPRCKPIPRAQISLRRGGLEVLLRCAEHGEVPRREWTPEAGGLSAWSDGSRGAVYVLLLRGSWCRASFVLEDGRLRDFGLAIQMADRGQ